MRIGVVALAAAALIAGPSVPAGAATLSTVTETSNSATRQATDGVSTVAAVPTRLTVQGRGYGHGRGLGQYGALGYATGQGWSSARILDHFYRGTTASRVGNPVIGVELMAWSGKSAVTIVGSRLAVNGRAVTAKALRFTRDPDGNFTIYGGWSCSGPWTRWSRTAGSHVSSSVTSNPATFVQTCGSSGTSRGYRGTLWVGGNSARSMRVVNRVNLDTYLRGVLPREMPASWASAGGGKGTQALRAQAVAARSYAMASRRATYAQTCDTTACQVYGGAFTRTNRGTVSWLEDSRTNAAVAATSGLVRRKSSGAIARTEFSSSTGGHTAGGDFAAVPDAGDAVSSNPNRTWTRSLTWADVQKRIGRGTLVSLTVTQRDGRGASGGRALKVAARTTTGATYTYTGEQIRQRLGLKSSWFVLSAQAG